jgi:hypothetical protein
VRSFAHTAPRYLEFLRANPGTDVFGLVGDYDAKYPAADKSSGPSSVLEVRNISNRHLSLQQSSVGPEEATVGSALGANPNQPQRHHHRSHHAAEKSLPGAAIWHHAGLDEALDATRSWPGFVSIVGEKTNPWPFLQSVLGWDSPKQCGTTLQGALLQAYKIRRCQDLIEKHVRDKRSGAPYELIVRSRFDVLLPPEPALNLSRFSDILRSYKLNLTNAQRLAAACPTDLPQPLLAAPRRILTPGRVAGGAKMTKHPGPIKHAPGRDGTDISLGAAEIEKPYPQSNEVAGHLMERTPSNRTKAAMADGGWWPVSKSNPIIDVPPYKRNVAPIGIMFVPFHADWDGLNDQFAIGTHSAMEAYAFRLNGFAFRKSGPGAGVCPRFGSETMTLHSLIEHKLICRHGFKADAFAIHRFWYEYTLLRELNLKRFESNVKAGDTDAEYRLSHAIVSGKHLFYGLVNVGTICSTDQSKASPRQGSVSGRNSWNAASLHCQLDPNYGKRIMHSSIDQAGGSEQEADALMQPNETNPSTRRVAHEQSRFALCLSGEPRSFSWTAPRYVEFLRANPGTDVFAFMGDYPVVAPTSELLLNKPHVSPKKHHAPFKPGTSMPFGAVQKITADLPGFVSIVVDKTNPWPHFPSTLHFSGICDVKTQSSVLQAFKIRRCQDLIDKHVRGKRSGKPYELIMRSRFDILLPPEPALNLSRFLDFSGRTPLCSNTIGHNRTAQMMHRSSSVSEEVVHKDNDLILGDDVTPVSDLTAERLLSVKVEANSRVVGHLFVPFNSDW